MLHSVPCLIFLLSLLIPGAIAQSVENAWVTPDGQKPDFSQTFNNGNTLALFWQGWNDTIRLSYLKGEGSPIGDLWVTSTDPDQVDYSQLLTKSVDITQRGTYSWTVNIDTKTLSSTAKFCLRFVPPGDKLSIETPNIPSPGFIVMPEHDTAPLTGSTTSTGTETSSTPGTTSAPSSSVEPPRSSSTGLTSVSHTAVTKSSTPISTQTSTSSSTSSTTPSSTSPANAKPAASLKTAAIIGIAVGAAVLLIIILVLLAILWRQRRREKPPPAKPSFILNDFYIPRERALPKHPIELATATPEFPTVANTSELHGWHNPRKGPAPQRPPRPAEGLPEFATSANTSELHGWHKSQKSPRPRRPAELGTATPKLGTPLNTYELPG